MNIKILDRGGDSVPDPAAEPAAGRASRSNRQTSGWLSAKTAAGRLRDYAALILFAGLFITLSITSSVFLTQGNLLNILSQQAPLMIVAAASTMVIIAGSFDLSTGSIVAVTNVAAAQVAIHSGSNSLGLLTAPALGLLLGIVNGVVITVLRVHSFLGTLATSLVYSALALLLTNGSIISVDDPAFANLGQGTWGPVTISSIVMVVWVLVAMVVLNRTVVGRHVFAVGGNSEAAALSGVSVRSTHIFTFAASGLACGIAAAIIVSRVSSGQPTQGADITLNAIAAVILGGTSIYGGAGALWRSLTGVYLLALIGNGFNLLGANQFYKSMVTGVVIVAAVALAAVGRRRT